MDPDALEHLLIDRELGSLPPDVEALLQAYLERDPAASALAGHTRETVDLARRELAAETPSSLPAFPVEGFMAIERWRRRVRQVGYGVGLAACLLLGIGIGRLAFVPSPSPEAPAPTTLVERPHHAEPEPAAVQTDGFWSTRRWIERVREAPPRKPRRVIWDSLLAPPRSGDST